MNKMHFRLFAVTAAVLTGHFAVPAFAACREVDDFSPVMALAARTADMSADQEAAAFEREIVAKQPMLYNGKAMFLTPGPALDRRSPRSLAYIRHSGTVPDTFAKVRSGVRGTARLYERTFTDFRCTFTIYYADTLMTSDGGGREVDGHPALVFGIDQVDQERSLVSLDVFLAHEFFHRYHFQAAGFSDDLEDRQVIWRGLWAEGMASYVSGVLTHSTLAKALLVDDAYEAKAKAVMPQIAADLLAHFDEVNPEAYGSFFYGGSKRAATLGYPPRCGYYVGYRVAQALAKTHSLNELAHLKGEPLKVQIIKALQSMAD